MNLVERLKRQDRGALSRLLTLAAQGQAGPSLTAALREPVTAAPPVIGLTGAAGVGKSSLLGAMVTQFAEGGARIGVLACDPESPVSGGSLLGDRCRIATASAAEGIFVRSLSTVSGQQGIAPQIDLMLELMKAFGFDWVFVETVGAGQGDVAVQNVADVVALILQPQTGDELQWEKAGILELAQVVVVNKSDLPGADRTVADVSEQLKLTGEQAVPVVKTSVARGEGIDELCRAIEEVVSSLDSEITPHATDRGGRDQQRSGWPRTGERQTPGPFASRRTLPQGAAAPDPLLTEIADYVCGTPTFSEEAFSTARLCLFDSLGCALLALNFPECRRLLGPVVPGPPHPNGSRVPGTAYELDPVTAAFNIGCLIRWLDYNDTWLAAEWGHPSDNFGGILAVGDYVNRNRSDVRLTASDILTAAIKAYEIQGVLALENAFNRVGLDHVILVRIATTAVVTHLLGGSRQQVVDALSNAWLDGGALRTYRHAPNTGPRKSWAAGDATRRGVQLALQALAGEPGYASALSAPEWGFEDAVLGGQKLVLPRELGGYVMENILFKVAFPAEFHAQTAAEAAFRLHDQLAGRLEEIDRIHIETQEAAIRIISKTGPLLNPADRDHCLQYIVAVALLRGHLTAEDYEAAAAADPRIDALRERMIVTEQPRYSRDYLDPEKRSIAGAVQVFFRDGTASERVEVEYPLGHRRRRAEAIPLLKQKFRNNARTGLSSERVERMEQLWESTDFENMPIDEFLDEFVAEQT